MYKESLTVKSVTANFVQKLPDLKELSVLHLEYPVKRYCPVYILVK